MKQPGGHIGRTERDEFLVAVDLVPAAQSVEAADRAGVERFCRYGLRAPLSQERLTRREEGRLVYHLRRPGRELEA